MAISSIILCIGLVSQVFGNALYHVYPENCEPPIGYGNNTGVTTDDYYGLRPIERCCPSCSKCAHLGGFCALRWAVDLYKKCCDFEPIEPCRDYNCKCCIICGDDKCSPCVETGGDCRKECRPGELEDTSTPCSYSSANGTEGCVCCKRCEPTNECLYANGKCVTDPLDCHFGTYPSTGCCGSCFCCKPVLEPVPGTTCAHKDGFCTDGDECPAGYYNCPNECAKTEFNNGLKTLVPGNCCIPK